MEGAVVGVAVALGGHHHPVLGAVRVGALDEEDVGLLARLEDAELGVDGTAGGDDPVGARLGTLHQGLEVVPGGPALVGSELVGVAGVVEDEPLVDLVERVVAAYCGGARGEEPLGKLVRHRCSVGEEVGLGTGRGQSSSCHGSSRTVAAQRAAPVRRLGATVPDGSRRAQPVFRVRAVPCSGDLVPPSYVGRVLATVVVAPVLLTQVASGEESAPAGSAGIGDAYWPLDGNGGIDVASYRIRNRYDLDAQRLEGRTVLELTATSDLGSFNLDFLLPTSKVTVDGAARPSLPTGQARAADHPRRAAGGGVHAPGRRPLRRQPRREALRRRAQLAGQRPRGRGDEPAAHGAVVVPRQRPPQRQGDLRHLHDRRPRSRGDRQRHAGQQEEDPAHGHVALAGRGPDGDVPRVLRRRRLPDRARHHRRAAVGQRRLHSSSASATGSARCAPCGPARRSSRASSRTSGRYPVRGDRRHQHRPPGRLRAREPDPADLPRARRSGARA